MAKQPKSEWLGSGMATSAAEKIKKRKRMLDEVGEVRRGEWADKEKSSYKRKK